MPDLNTLRPGLPAALLALVKKAAAKAPAQRFETATEMLRALEAVLPELPEDDSAHEWSLWEHSDEHSPTLIWQRPTDVAESHARRHARPLRAVEPSERALHGVSVATPLGYRARRPVMAAKFCGWREASACV